ncbi:MAG: hypothetical protein NVS1B7_4990 [Candidatus Saccharimonadales bacterium]
MNRERREIFYSIVIIIIVPVLLAVNTLLLTNSIRRVYNIELTRKADLANTIIAESVNSYLKQKDTTNIANFVTTIGKNRPEVKNIVVLVPSTSGYSIIAQSTNAMTTIKDTDRLQFDVVSARRQSVAKLITLTNATGGNEQAWSVASPLLDKDQRVTAIVSTAISTSDADNIINAAFQKSFIIVVLSTFVIIALLFHHFRFVGYADLLRKQRNINQTMADFMSVATHELKAPMTLIKGYASQILDGDFGAVAEQTKTPLTVIITQTERLNNLVLDLLNISRIEQGRITFDMKPVDISVIVSMLVNQFEARAKEKNITIQYKPTDVAWVFADAGRVQEIMTNLLDNAIKYSVQGTVTINHSLKGSMLKTSVRDTGIGMSADERDRLFERFYRVKNEQTKDINGTGLGLWIIKQYIVKMGGSIAVDSMPGVGTEFTVSLKLANRSPSKLDGQ